MNFIRSIQQPRSSCVGSLQVFYGIGKTKAITLNRFLLGHPFQSEFNINFETIKYGNNYLSLWKKVKKDNSIRIYVSECLNKKIKTFCYPMFRLFQGLPTKGQRTKANGKCHRNQNPYKALRAELDFYKKYERDYKKLELKLNQRYDELKAYETQISNETRIFKEEKKHKQKQIKQNFIKQQRFK